MATQSRTAVDWSQKPPPWNFLGPEIAAAIKKIIGSKRDILSLVETEEKRSESRN